jgi:hypothetical protein
VTAHSLIHQEAARPQRRRVKRNGLLQLGWPHFWLLSGILGAMLALVALVFLISSSPAF